MNIQQLLAEHCYDPEGGVCSTPDQPRPTTNAEFNALYDQHLEFTEQQHTPTRYGNYLRYCVGTDRINNSKGFTYVE